MTLKAILDLSGNKKDPSTEQGRVMGGLGGLCVFSGEEG